MTNPKIFCSVLGQSNSGTDSIYVNYAYTPPLKWFDGVIETGQVTVDITGLTESEINIKNQESVIIRCQLEADGGGSGVVFSLADIRGGRI
jgi:hypothetical protein